MATIMFMSGAACACGGIGCVALTGVGTPSFRRRAGAVAELAIKLAGLFVGCSTLVS